MSAVSAVPAAVHGHPAAGMALVHLTVAALTAWWLHRGERALWLVIRLYATPLPIIGLPAAVPAEVPLPPRPAPIPAGVPTPTGRTACRTVTRRGPPPRLRLRSAS
ncbi:MAG: hypothetical protein HOV86_35370 [Thermoactinospora sp.]|nr:hypothetical protein [Thermoactinospora sp.]